MIPGCHEDIRETNKCSPAKAAAEDPAGWIEDAVWRIVSPHSSEYRGEPDKTIRRFLKKAGFDPGKIVALVEDEYHSACGEESGDNWEYVSGAFLPDPKDYSDIQTSETTTLIGKTWGEDWTDEDYEKMAELYHSDADSIRAFREGVNDEHLWQYYVWVRKRESLFTTKPATIIKRQLCPDSEISAHDLKKEMQKE